MSSPRSKPLLESLGEPAYRPRVQATSPALRQAQLCGDVIEAFSFEVVPLNQGALLFRELLDALLDELEELRSLELLVGGGVQ